MKTMVGCIGAGNIVRAILTGADKGQSISRSDIGIFDVVDKVREEFKGNGYTVYESI